MPINTDVMCNQACHGWATGTFELSACAGLSQRSLILALSNDPDQVSSHFMSLVMLSHAYRKHNLCLGSTLAACVVYLTVSGDNGRY